MWAKEGRCILLLKAAAAIIYFLTQTPDATR